MLVILVVTLSGFLGGTFWHLLRIYLVLVPLTLLARLLGSFRFFHEVDWLVFLPLLAPASAPTPASLRLLGGLKLEWDFFTLLKLFPALSVARLAGLGALLL